MSALSATKSSHEKRLSEVKFLRREARIKKTLKPDESACADYSTSSSKWSHLAGSLKTIVSVSEVSAAKSCQSWKMSVRVTPDTMLEKERKTMRNSYSLRLTEVDHRFRASQNKGFSFNQGSYVVCPSVVVPTEEDNSCDPFAANGRSPKEITALENSLTTPVMTSAVVQLSGPSRCASRNTGNLFALPFGESCSSASASSRATAQRTTCRELLEYTVEDHGEEGKAGDTVNDTSGRERTSSRNGVEKDTLKTGTKKRPLLLPPIMLPPIYTVKPKPMRLREQMFSLTPTSRNLQTISDDEWAKLSDCRYLRLRFNKEAAVKV